MTSSAWTVERRTGISTSTPRRWSLYARSPPIFTADAAGTGSSISPRRASSRRASSSSAGASKRSTTSPSRSPVDVRELRSRSVTYRLSRPTKHEASLVADPDNTSSNPVAKGSRVPAWPVRAPVRRRTEATIAKEDGPAGLSTRNSPLGLRPRGGTREKLAPDELGDLFNRVVAREARRLAMSPAAGLPGDRGNVELVVARAKADPSLRPVGARRLTNQGRHVGAFNRTKGVDDPFGVGLGCSDVCEVAAHQVRDDKPAA